MDKKVIICDLDGTLAQSKQQLDKEMVQLLRALIDRAYVIAIMSGGSFEQYSEQVLPSLEFTPQAYEQVYLLPTSGAALYRYRNDHWEEVYRHVLSPEDKTAIVATLSEAARENGIAPERVYGEQIEDRGSQITYSALGQHAPVAEKEKWDPDHLKRKKIVAYFSERLPQFDIHIGGMTSIDVTHKGIDKTYGVLALSKLLALPVASMVYIGDALYPGGNDAPVRRSGIDCIAVQSVEATKAWLRNFLSQNRDTHSE
ncbi:MAG TPA: HAD-IIB family hydrolase [Candidatus Paceibacterota bacterium]|nr:HAD-IIB family hydrolase [Candidatus Paceibacterota bacterium]